MKKIKEQVYCYTKESTYIDASIGEIWCVKLFRSENDERIPGFFENFHDAKVACNMMNNLYRKFNGFRV